MTSTDLLAGVTEARARELSRDLEEPDWLLDERLDAVRLVADLPDRVEHALDDLPRPPSGPLRRRHASLGGGSRPRPSGGRRRSAARGCCRAHPHRRRSGGRSRALAAGGRRPASSSAPSAEALRQPKLAALLRSAIDGGRSIGADDRFGQVSRAIASIGILVHVPDGVELDGPIVVRWTIAEPGTALVGRTVVILGERARAGLLEELEGAAAGSRDERWPRRRRTRRSLRASGGGRPKRSSATAPRSTSPASRTSARRPSASSPAPRPPVVTRR